MGAINYLTSNYITMGTMDDLDDVEQVEILNKIEELIDEEYYFYYYYVTIKHGYYDGFSIYIENNFDVAYDSCYDKREAKKEITQLKKFLLDCANNGMVVCFPGWCTGYITDYKEIQKEINNAIKNIRDENEDTPTWLWYERNQYAGKRRSEK